MCAVSTQLQGIFKVLNTKLVCSVWPRVGNQVNLFVMRRQTEDYRLGLVGKIIYFIHSDLVLFCLVKPKHSSHSHIPENGYKVKWDVASCLFFWVVGKSVDLLDFSVGPETCVIRFLEALKFSVGGWVRARFVGLNPSSLRREGGALSIPPRRHKPWPH